jgi:hypothetical protein
MIISDTALGIDRWRLLGENLRSQEIFADIRLGIVIYRYLAISIELDDT